MYFKINIPEPCGENWHDMTPTEQGKFCSSCKKEVIDFTKYTDSEIANRFKNGKHLCGRFRAGQLEREIFAPSEKSKTPWKLVASFTTLMAMAGGASAQDDKNTEVEQKVYTASTNNLTLQTEIFRGNVKDENGLPLAGATVVLEGSRFAAQTDLEGNYEIKVPIDLIDEFSKIHITYLGFKELRTPLNKKISCIMVEDHESITTGIIVITKSRTKKPRSRWMRRHR